MYFFLFQDMVQVADSLSINPSPTICTSRNGILVKCVLFIYYHLLNKCSQYNFRTDNPIGRFDAINQLYKLFV